MGKKQGRGLVTGGSEPLAPPPPKGRPKGSGHMSRSTQQAGTRAAQRARQVREARGAGAMMGELAEVAYGDEEEMDGDPSTWGVRCQKAHDAWDANANSCKGQFLQYLAINIQRSQNHAQTYQKQLQSELDSWLPSSCCHCDTTSLCVSSKGQVTYYGRTCTFNLTISTFQCQCCGKKVEPPPLAFGCFPSSPTQAHVWWELQLLHQYRREAHDSGLSITGKGTRLSLR